MKKIGFLSVFIFAFYSALMAQDITGFWKTVDEKTGKAQSMVAVYEYHGKYYGRIIGTFDDSGKMVETIYNPKGRAPGIQGNPYYCGMDIIWNLRKREDSDRYKGKIVDPEKGNIYKAEVWVEKGKLIVRGEVLFFGRNQTWPPAVNSDFPTHFIKPNLKTLVPVIPKVNS